MPDTAVFDHYEVMTRDDGSLFELGRGAMGITYKAFDTSLRIPVALKVINGTYLNSEIARQRFIREARSAAQLRHRHVASVFHLGTEGDTWFYAMEFIDGETLDALIKQQGPLNPVIALTIAGQVARALNAAAQHGLVHRDIKPANLMLVKEDDELIAKVIDFGLAKVAVVGEGEDAATLSISGFVGTPHFASPEQLEERVIDTRSDIYSLGVTLWYMLAGQAPFAGSMAQVMSQHLSKPPPFEKLPNLPLPVAGVLRLMLAKDPAARYQTPADLRKGIEAALEELANLSSSASVSPEAARQPEDFTALLEDSTARAAMGSFETNTTIANRYRVAQSYGETNGGRVFRAYDTERKSEVRLLVLHPEVLGNGVALSALEQEVEKLVPVKHPNLLGVYGFETVDRGSFVVLEWTEGFSLLDLLKARRELEADEALELLEQAAEGADKALSLSLNKLEFGLHQLSIHFPQPVEKEKLLRAPLSTWPAFELKLYPLSATRDFATSQTWAGGQTMVGSSGGKSASGGAESRPQYVQALGAVVYEILGGTLSPLAPRGGPAIRYTPLSTLSEEGNEVLRRALDPASSFPSAREFSAALSRLSDLQVRYHEPRSTASLSSAPVAPVPPPVPPSVAPAITPPQPKTVPIALIGGLAVAFVAIFGAIGFYFLHPQSAGGGLAAVLRALGWHRAAAHGNSSGDSATTTTDNNNNTTSDTKPVVGNDTPAATPIPVTPLPGPTRQDLLKSAVAEADELERRGDWPKSLEALLRITKDYPDSPVGKNHLETMLNHLRDRPSPITFEEFQSMRDQIIECAQLDILSAMLLIGDSLRTREPQTAAHWFSVAADKGDPSGLVNYGIMLKKGLGVDKPDPEAAAALFQKAAEKGDVGGEYELAGCYFNGQGVIADQKRAVDLFHEAADAGDSRAMDELGYCYSHGLGVAKDFNTAFHFYSTAAERGNLEATGNLGVLYLKGQGVAANLKKGAELFEKGAKAGSPYCMGLYAAALEEGLGVPANKMLATTWYRKAAAAGNRAAIDWCNAKSIPYGVGN